VTAAVRRLPLTRLRRATSAGPSCSVRSYAIGSFCEPIWRERRRGLGLLPDRLGLPPDEAERLKPSAAVWRHRGLANALGSLPMSVPIRKLMARKHRHRQLNRRAKNGEVFVGTDCFEFHAGYVRSTWRCGSRQRPLGGSCCGDCSCPRRCSLLLSACFERTSQRHRNKSGLNTRNRKRHVGDTTGIRHGC